MSPVADVGSPTILALAGQFIVYAVLAPLWFFSFSLYAYLTTDTPGRAAISASDAAAVLLTLVLAYYPASLGMYFHPDYQARFWWSWVWQFYPVWGALVFAISRRVLRPIVKLPAKYVRRTTIGIMMLFNACLWWYTVRSADIGLFDAFVPRYLLHLPEDPVVPLRALLQYDHIGSFGTVSIWLVLAIRDMKNHGMTQVPLAALSVAGVGVTVGLGWCNAILLGWLWREELLAMHVEDTAPVSKTK
jgi:hypothetical protein